MVNQKLRSAREKKHWSMSVAAAKVGVAKLTYLRWENGDVRPRGESLEMLCTAFDMADAELGYGQQEEQGSKTAQDTPILTLTASQVQELYLILGLGESTVAYFDQERRETLRKILTVAGASALPSLLNPEPWQRLSIAATKAMPLNQSTLQHFEHLITISWQLSNGNELEVAEQLVPQFLPRLMHVAPYQPEAAVLASQGLQLESILAAHRLKLSDKVLLCQKAVEYARTTHDQNTLVAALIQLAVAYLYNNQDDSALRTYQEALQYCNSDHVSPLLRSRTYIEAAATLAKYQRTKEADFYLNMAYEMFPEHPEQDPTYLYADYNRGVLALYNGMISLDSGNAEQAWNGFESFRDFRKLNCPRNGLLLQEKISCRDEDGTDRGDQSVAGEHSQGTQGQRTTTVYGANGASPG